ncbi:MAG: DUF805 domain-containing protein [Sphingomonadales bacterium]
MEWMILPFKRYFQFSGRSRRKEFWMYMLFVIAVSIVLSIVDAMLGLGGSTYSSNTLPSGATGYGASAGVNGGLLAGLFSLATIIPSITVQVRRLHDTNRTGWWILIPIVPATAGAVLLLGGTFSGIGSGGMTAASGGAVAAGGVLILVGFMCAIALLVFMCLDGTRGPNRFGPDPKNPEANLGEVFS